MVEKKLSGKVALVTGGARGIGRGCALRLAKLGADIAIIDRNLKGFEVYEFEKKQMAASTVMDEGRALGVKAMGLEVDLADRAATGTAIDEIVKKMGRIDIAVCSAGGGTVKFADEIKPGEAVKQSEVMGVREGDAGPGDIATTGTPSDCPQDMLMRVLNNNLMACMYTCMAVAPYMKKQKSGKIVTVSSMEIFIPRGILHPYGTAKAAIAYYTRALAQDLGPYNINVNCIAPGVIHTGRLGERSNMAKQIALRREGTVEDCAKVVEFLVTDLSDYVTGQIVTVDGGARDQRYT